MIIIGINAYHGDASAAVFKDGIMIAAIEEERFTRIKHWAGFPEQAVRFCLREAGINIGDVDYFAIGRDPKAKFFRKLLYLISHPTGSLSAVRDRFSNSMQVASVEKQLSAIFKEPLSFFSGKIRHVEHHRSHLASAFFASPFHTAACISIDGSGDFSTTMTGTGFDKHIEVTGSVDFPHSIGFFYTACTQLLGFPHYGDEYKVMGMAPYGTARYTHLLEKVITKTDDGFFRLNLRYFRKGTSGISTFDEDFRPSVATLYTDAMIDLLGKPRQPQEPLTSFHQDMAASVQKVTEDVIFHMLSHLHKKTGLKKLCLAGGVAQNSVANGKITRSTGFDEVYVPSAGHDAGISMGAALYVQHEELKMERKPAIFSAYTGSRFSDEEITDFLNSVQASFEMPDYLNLLDMVTNCIMNGGVVGWFQGRAEFGPRALGGRSILADPRRADAKDLINMKIKRRESFRPFAPSILKEYVSEYFEHDEPVPFMEKVFPIKKDKQPLIPAVTHVDGSGRLQTVDRNVAPLYYDLIETFQRKTGIPILLNTSFNENEPIVNSPKEAYDCFARTSMDMLVMGHVVIRRKV